MNKKISIHIYFLFIYIFSYSQESIDFINYSRINGLSDNFITQLDEDQNGLIWISTQNGLNSFDGKTFNTYLREDSTNKSILRNYIKCSYIDKKRNQWYGSFNGVIMKYLPEVDSFENKSLSYLILNEYPTIHRFYESENSDLYAISSRGIFKYSQTSSKFVKPKWKFYSIYESEIFDIYIDKKDNTWICTQEHGIVWIDAARNKSVNISLDKSNVNEVYRPNVILPLSDSILLAGTSKGLYLIKHSDFGTYEIVERFPELKDVFIKAIDIDKHGNAWIGTSYKGVWKLTASGDLFQIKNNKTVNNDIINITSIFCDSRNRIWIGTLGNGIFLHNPNKSNISKISSNNNLNHNIVSAIITDTKKNIWIATDGGGISVFSPKMELIRSFTVENGLPTNLILDLTLQNNTIWASSWQGGLISIDLKTYSIKSYNSSNSGLTNNAIKSVCAQGNDTILIANHGSPPSLLYNKNDKIVIEKIKMSKPRYFPNTHYYSNEILVDKTGTYWVATIRNLYMIKNGTVTEIIKDNSLFFPHFPINIYSIALDKKGYILAGTNSGLFRINIYNQKIEEITNLIPELSKSLILTVFVSSVGDYWIASTKGLFQYSTNLNKAKRIPISDISDGLFFTPRAIHEDSDGKLYFGTIDGVYFFSPNDLNWENSIIGLSFNDLFLSYKRVTPGDMELPKQMRYTDTIYIKSEFNNWGLSFGTICFTDQNSIQYAYMLEGFDKDWNLIGNKQEINFTNIPHGEYTMKLKAWKFNSNNEISKNIHVVIEPAWWETLLFKILVILFSIGVILLVYYLRILSLKKQNIKLEALVNAKTSELHEKNEKIEKQNSVLRQFSAKLEKTNNLLLNKKVELEYLTSELQSESNELTELNATLKNVNQTKEQILSIITHDVRNSFISIQSLTGTLLNELHETTNTKVKNYLSNFSKAIQNTSDILNNLLAWSKTQTTSIECNPEFCNLNEIIKSVIESYSHAIKEKKISIDFNTSETSEVFADTDMIVTVLRNIINNAIKFTPSGGFIIVNIKENGEYLECHIRDSGKGIEKDVIDKLFSVDSKQEKTIKSETKSYGLGLIVSQQFIEKNKGMLRVIANMDKGTTFIVCLPKQRPELILKKDIEVEKTLIRPDISIAIIEDNQAILRLISEYFGNIYNKVLFNSGQEFLNYLRSNTIDLVISDILMPGIDGFTLCKEIKHNKQTMHIPVILISSRSDDSTKEQSYKFKADAFFEKPVSKAVLLACAEKLLQDKQKVNHSFTNLIPTDGSDIVDEFLKNFDDLLKKNIANSDYSVDDMASELNLSRSQLFRKIKQHFTISPKDYFIKIRMQAAAELLQFEEIKIIDVAFSTGFTDPSYFSRCFIKHFGVTPSEYRNSLLLK